MASNSRLLFSSAVSGLAGSSVVESISRSGSSSGVSDKSSSSSKTSPQAFL